MPKYKGRYGLSSVEVCTLYESCWRGKDLNNGCDWKNFDEERQDKEGGSNGTN